MDLRLGETPSSGCHASARGLAKLAAIMANKGSLGEIDLLSKYTWDLMHGDHKV